MHTIIIDGAQGEGGGQVFRTALTLAMLKQVKVSITNIRANRNKPGLLRQHLTCLRAAQTICNAAVTGDQLGSSEVSITPGKVQAGEYHFSVGSAGSTSLVCQTILLPLAIADGESQVTFEGGTHNPLAPSVSFLQASYLPILKLMGITAEVSLERYGFYPAGGGKWQLRIFPVELVKGFSFDKHSEPVELDERHVTATALISRLPHNIANRELKELRKQLRLSAGIGEAIEVDSPGPGNCLQLALRHAHHQSFVEVPGEMGVSAERVARRTAGWLKKLLMSDGTVEEHLADQLLLPMVLAGSGRFYTTEPSLHTQTNRDVIESITGVAINIEQVSDNTWCISL